MSAPEIAAALGDELTTLVLLRRRPAARLPRPRRVGARARPRDHRHRVRRLRQRVGRRSTPNVVFPAESYAEKEGTVTHPDGRVQRAAPGDRRPGEVRPQRSVLLDLISALLGTGSQLSRPAMLSSRSSRAVPFYGGLTLEEIGGRGLRWQERDAASGSTRPSCPTPSSRRRPSSARRRRLHARHRAVAVGRPRDRARADAALPLAAPARGALRRGRRAARHRAPATRSRWPATARACARWPRCARALRAGHASS